MTSVATPRPAHRPPPPDAEAPEAADAPRLAAAGAFARGGRVRRDLPAGQDRLPELHQPGVPRARADEMGRPAELPRAVARHGVPALRLEDRRVHADHRRLRVRARTGHRPRRQLELQGARRHACRHARSVGDPDRGRRADVEVDARRHVRRRERRRHAAAHPFALAARGSPTRARPWPRSALSTSGRRHRSSPSSCSPGSR